MSIGATGGISLKLLKGTAMVKSISAITGQAIEENFVDTFVEVAKEKARYKTGNLRRSIASKKKSMLGWEIFTATGYGAYVELGTKRMPAYPYFAPAYEVARKEFARNAFR